MIKNEIKFDHYFYAFRMSSEGKEANQDKKHWFKTIFKKAKVDDTEGTKCDEKVDEVCKNQDKSYMLKLIECKCKEEFEDDEDDDNEGDETQTLQSTDIDTDTCGITDDEDWIIVTGN